MPTRAAAVPRASDRPTAGSVPAATPPASDKTVSSPVVAEYSDFVFSESSPDFHLDADIDPVDADAEEAAVLFANGQDEAVCAVLENAVRMHHFGPGERLWMMLFDLYRLKGKRAPFDALAIDYAHSFEKSPPAWSEKSIEKPRPVVGVSGLLLFHGDLTGDNASSFVALREALEKKTRVRLDVSKVARVDASGCALLLSCLQEARKNKQEFDLLGREVLEALLGRFVVPGTAENKECWLLYLELCQLQGKRDVFEDVAVDYAVTFEMSPPSWEGGRAVSCPPGPAAAAGNLGRDVAVNAYVLQGDVKNSRFADLAAHAELHDAILIDCADLVRMDFISAGSLLNVLATLRRAGKTVIFRHPNHLVAELFAVVGLKAVARIEYAKR